MRYLIVSILDLCTLTYFGQKHKFIPPGCCVCCPFPGSGSVVVNSLFTVPIVCGFYVWLLFCNAALSVFSSFTTISMRNRELAVMLCLCSCCSCCHVTVSVLSLPNGAVELVSGL